MISNRKASDLFACKWLRAPAIACLGSLLLFEQPLISARPALMAADTPWRPPPDTHSCH